MVTALPLRLWIFPRYLEATSSTKPKELLCLERGTTAAAGARGTVYNTAIKPLRRRLRGQPRAWVCHLLPSSLRRGKGRRAQGRARPGWVHSEGIAWALRMER